MTDELQRLHGSRDETLARGIRPGVPRVLCATGPERAPEQAACGGNAGGGRAVPAAAEPAAVLGQGRDGEGAGDAR